MAVMHWDVLLVLRRRRVALPDRTADFAGQTKTPDLQEARGFCLAGEDGRPVREGDAAKRDD